MIRTGLLVLALGAWLAPTATAATASINQVSVYSDQLDNGFVDWSWTPRDLASTTFAHSGTHSISMSANNWGGLYLHRSTDLMAISDLDTLQFWVRGGGAGGQLIDFALDLSGTVMGAVQLESYIVGGSIPAGSWAKVVVPLRVIVPADSYYDGIIFQARGNNDQGTVYFDDLLLLGGVPAGPSQPLSIAISPALDRHPVSPLIYGVNFGSTAEFTDLPYPVRRWGGNATTRYSWQNDTQNRAMDWFFLNIPNDVPDPSHLPDGSTADLFVGESRGAGADVVVTVPTIGWTPTDRTKRWGFSVSKYGAQTQTECSASGGADWCAPDAGNGTSSATNNPISGNDPHDTSVPIGPDFVAGWVQHLMGKFGPAESGGVKYYALDNEPMLWNSTHRDVHPAGVSYDELWNFTVNYASRLKTVDPNAKILGPDCWGWCDYFYSAADGCGSGPDQAAHGGTPLLDWYLQQVHAYQVTNGTRLIDLLDIHYYPQTATVNDDESPGVATLRLRSVKSLYDSTYVDPSWIGQVVKLIPRMKKLIAQRAPGLGLAITEYNFGGDTGITSAIATAEALAVFGREGVELATRWEAPKHGTLVQDAFRLYLDYDGAGSQVKGSSVRAVSGNVDRVGAYAVLDGFSKASMPASASGSARPRLYALLFNKNVVDEPVHVTVADSLVGGVTLYRFTSSRPLTPVGSVTAHGGSVDLVLPARSATLAVLDRSTGNVDVDPAPRGDFAMLGIRPNPVRGAGVFSFTLPDSAPSTLELYDAMGRRVWTRRLSMGAGTHSVELGRGIAPGLYMVRLEHGGRTLTSRIALVR